MKDLHLPEKILNIVKNKDFKTDDSGMSDSSVLIFDDMVLKVQPDSQFIKNEHAIMDWLEDKIFVPKCLCNLTENGINYLLMSKIPGKMSCDNDFMNDPKFLISIIADSMKELWRIDISDCPVKNDLSTMLSAAAYRVEHGLVNVDDAEPDTFGKEGFKSPESLLNWLYDGRPEEDFVLSHGDFSLPNIFINEGKFSGFVDLGRMGMADKYQDIAICCRSLHHNFSGIYSGFSYEGYDEKLFFSALE